MSQLSGILGCGKLRFLGQGVVWLREILGCGKLRFLGHGVVVAERDSRVRKADKALADAQEAATDILNKITLMQCDHDEAVRVLEAAKKERQRLEEEKPLGQAPSPGKPPEELGIVLKELLGAFHAIRTGLAGSPVSAHVEHAGALLESAVGYWAGAQEVPATQQAATPFATGEEWLTAATQRVDALPVGNTGTAGTGSTTVPLGPTPMDEGGKVAGESTLDLEVEASPDVLAVVDEAAAEGIVEVMT